MQKNVLERIYISDKDYKSNQSSYSYNTIAKTNNNVLFSTFSEGNDENFYQIKVKRSDDGGINWTDCNFPIVEKVNQYCPSIAIDLSNVIHIVWYGHISISGSDTRKILYSKSNTGGKTWTKPIVLQPLNGYEQSHPTIISNTANNSLHVAWSGTDNLNTNSQVKHCYSEDGGETWSFYKNIREIKSNNQNSVQLIYDKDGSMYAFWINTVNKTVQICKSIDNGETWLSITEVKPYNSTASSMNIAYLSAGINLQNGDILLAISVNSNTQLSFDSDTEKFEIKNYICEIHSIDNGQNWSDFKILSNQNDNQYITKVQFVNDRFNIFWMGKTNRSVNNMIQYKSTTDFINYSDTIYLTPANENAATFSVLDYKNYFLIQYNSFNVNLLTKYGFRKYLIQDNTKLKKIVMNSTEVVKQAVTFKSITGNSASYFQILDLKCQIDPSKPIKVFTNNSNETEYSSIENFKIDYDLGRLIYYKTAGSAFTVYVTYHKITYSLEEIGIIPATPELFTTGNDSIYNLTDTLFKSLESKKPNIIFRDLGMEYVRPALYMKGDVLSKYIYKVSMENMTNALKPWSNELAGSTSDSIKIKSSYVKNSEPQKIRIDVKQLSNDFTSSKTATVQLKNDAPLIDAKITGSRLDLKLVDADNDRVAFNILINGKKVYPLYTEYTNFVSTPQEFTYIFDKDDLKIDENNIVFINVKDEYEKHNFTRLDFTGNYVGLLFEDEFGNRYSTDSGELLKLLDLGVIRSGDESKVYKILLNNNNGFNVSNISIWSTDEVDNGDIYFSYKESPFENLNRLEFLSGLRNQEKLEFYIKLKTTEALLSGKSAFKIFARGEASEENFMIFK